MAATPPARKDYYLGPLHIIVRHYDNPQYGVLAWRSGKHQPFTIDLWAKRTLLTARWAHHI